MERAIPDRTIAGHHADLVVSIMSGIHPRDGRLWIGGAGPTGGGWGAKRAEDGMSATVCLNDGDTHNAPCEQMEAKYPVLFERHALREDSCGPGKHRGGLGTEQVIRAQAPMMVNIQVDRMHCQPWGLEGGLPGAGNAVTLRVAGREVEDLPNAKVLTRHLKPGDAFTLKAGGGGGFGSPLERDPARVAEDVRQGYVSRDTALNSYRVALTDAGTLDEAETRRLRSRKQARAAA
jgi:N-methylhydantoinase B